MPSEIIGLSDGDLSDPVQVPLGYKVVRMPSRKSRRTAFIPARPLSQGIAVALDGLGESYERLATMVLARKLSDEQLIGPSERERLVNLSGVPDAFKDSELTQMVFFATADQLGKGGVIGQITSVVNKVVNPISKVVSNVSKSVATVAKSIAPVLSVVPVVGPMISKAVGAAAGGLEKAASSSISSVVRDPLGIVKAASQGAAGAEAIAAGGFVQSVGYAVGGVAQGATQLVTGVAQPIVAGMGDAGSWIAGAVSGTISGGTKLAGGFGDNFFKGFKTADPAFANLLTSWEGAIASAQPGAFLGKIGGQMVSVVKTATGALNITKHDSNAIPPSISGRVGEGALMPADANLFPTTNTIAGTSSSMTTPAGASVSVNPAGSSMPSGPNGSGILTDQGVVGMITQAIKDAMGIEATPDGKLATKPVVKEAGVPWWAVIGMGGAVAYAMFAGGKGIPGRRRRR